MLSIGTIILLNLFFLPQYLGQKIFPWDTAGLVVLVVAIAWAATRQTESPF